jgi:phage terminase small subunit
MSSELLVSSASAAAIDDFEDVDDVPCVADDAQPVEDDINEQIARVETRFVELSKLVDQYANGCSLAEYAFAKEYVIDLHAGRAVLRSGCFDSKNLNSAHVTGWRLLKRAHVMLLINALKQQRAARATVRAEHVLAETALLANSDFSHYILDEVNGNVLLAPGAPLDATRAIQSIKKKRTEKITGDGTIVNTYEIDVRLWDKTRALHLLGKQVGLFPDKVELTGADGEDIRLVSRIERVIIDVVPQPAAEEKAS